MLDVLLEDNHLLVVAKPAGLITQGATVGEASLVTLARDYLKQKYHKPGNVYVGVVSRLDAASSGVVVLARTSKAAERLTNQFRERDVAKTYWALVGDEPPERGELRDHLWHDDAAMCVQVVPADHPGAKEAILRFARRARFSRGAWLEIELLTGRKHQIRVQLAHRGWPVWGDRKYGSAVPFPAGIALHAARVAFQHPVRAEPVVCAAPPPDSWRAWVKPDPRDFE